jgi:predicted metal-dependent hydrolase
MRLNFRFFPKPKPEPEQQRLVIAGDGELYSIEIRRHASARRYTIRVREASRDIVLTMPPRGSLRQAKSFAERNVAWIATRLKRLPGPVPFADGGTIPLRGVAHRIAHRPGARGTVWIEAGDDGEQLICVTGEPPHHNRRIGDFL